MAASVRTATHKVSYYASGDTSELYDLVADPGEVNNLWGSADNKDVQAEMMQLLTRRMIGTIDPLPERTSAF